MNTKSITSVSFILIGNMLTTYNSIGTGWAATLTAIFGLILFFIGLSRLKNFLDEKGKEGIRKLIWAAIIGIIATILSIIPIVGSIPAGILLLVAFILQLVGLLKLKQSTTLGVTGANGVNYLLFAIALMILASLFSILPFAGNLIKQLFSFIAFIIIPFGWLKIQEAIIDNQRNTIE